MQSDSHVTSKNSYISTIKYLDKSILDTRDLKTLIEEARLTESGNSFQQLILRTRKSFSSTFVLMLGLLRSSLSDDLVTQSFTVTVKYSLAVRGDNPFKIL